MYRAFLRYVLRVNTPAQHGLPLDITDRVQRKGDHYVKMGEYADLWLGIFDGYLNVAVKVLRGGSSTNPAFMENLNARLESGAVNWRQFDHQNVSAFYGIVRGWGYMPGLVLPLYQGTVVEFVSNQPENVDLRIEMLRQIAEGLHYIHSKGLVHGDMRGANVLMDNEGHPKICDCGLTFVIEPAEFTSVKTAGACRWTAPELMNPTDALDQDPNSLFNSETDIYAFGMLMLEVFTGKIPFSNKKNDSSVIFAVLDGGRPDIPSSIGDVPALKSLMELCWHQDPKMRPTSRAAADTLASVASSGSSSSSIGGWWHGLRGWI